MSRRLVAISIALLVAGFLVLLVVAGNGRAMPPGVVVAISTAVAAGATMLAARAVGKRSGGNAAGAVEAAQRLNLTARDDADAVVRAGFGDLREVPRKARIGNMFTGQLDGRGLVVFQSSYMVHTGQSAVMVAHTIYTAESPQWPRTHVVPRNYFGRLAVRLGRQRGLRLENAEFNIRFKVDTDDEDFAIALLSPQVQSFMLGKTSVRWKIDPGRVCLIYGGTLKPPRMDASLDRMRRFWSLVPPELEAW